MKLWPYISVFVVIIYRITRCAFGAQDLSEWEQWAHNIITTTDYICFKPNSVAAQEGKGSKRTGGNAEEERALNHKLSDDGIKSLSRWLSRWQKEEWMTKITSRNQPSSSLNVDRVQNQMKRTSEGGGMIQNVGSHFGWFEENYCII